MALRKPNSATVSVRELFKCSKDLASLVVSKKNFFLILGIRFFVSNIIRGVLLGYFGLLHLALGPNR